MVRRVVRRKRIISWLKRMGLTLLILLAIALVALLGFWLFQLSNSQKWSSEVNASVINLFVSVLTFVITVAITVHFNTQTQRMTLQMDQENKQLQMKIQKMNIDAMKYQARANIRDKIIEKRMEIYPEILKELHELHKDATHVEFGWLSISDFYDDKNFREYISGTDRAIKRILEDHCKNPFISNELKYTLRKYVDWKYLGYFSMYDVKISEKQILSPEQYFKIDNYFYTRARLIIEKELQLTDIENDINSMIPSEKYKEVTEWLGQKVRKDLLGVKKDKN